MKHFSEFIQNPNKEKMVPVAEDLSGVKGAALDRAACVVLGIKPDEEGVFPRVSTWDDFSQLGKVLQDDPKWIASVKTQGEKTVVELSHSSSSTKVREYGASLPEAFARAIASWSHSVRVRSVGVSAAQTDFSPLQTKF